MYLGQKIILEHTHFAFSHCGCLYRSVYSTVQSVYIQAPSTFSALKKVSNLSIHHIFHDDYYILECKVTKQSVKHFLLFLQYVFYLSAPSNSRYKRYFLHQNATYILKLFACLRV